KKRARGPELPAQDCPPRRWPPPHLRVGGIFVAGYQREGRLERAGSVVAGSACAGADGGASRLGDCIGDPHRCGPDARYGRGRARLSALIIPSLVLDFSRKERLLCVSRIRSLS